MGDLPGWVWKGCGGLKRKEMWDRAFPSAGSATVASELPKP